MRSIALSLLIPLLACATSESSSGPEAVGSTVAAELEERVDPFWPLVSDLQEGERVLVRFHQGGTWLPDVWEIELVGGSALQATVHGVHALGRTRLGERSLDEGERLALDHALRHRRNPLPVTAAHGQVRVELWWQLEEGELYEDLQDPSGGRDWVRLSTFSFVHLIDEFRAGGS